MGFSRHFFMEAKAYVLSAEEGRSKLRFIKRTRGISHVVLLGKVSVAEEGCGVCEIMEGWQQCVHRTKML